MLLIFGDGSVEASCVVAYLRWELEDGPVVCRLLAGKTRVAPKCKISIPRMELMGSLVAVRLYQKIKDSLCLEVSEIRFFTDSLAVLGMIFKDSGTFLEFVSTRVSEIWTKSKVDTEWFWVPGTLNPADMGDLTHDDPARHGGGYPLPDWAPVDVSAGQLASQKGLHLPASRRVPQGRDPGHVCSSADYKERADLPGEGDFQGEAGQNLLLCDDGSGRLPEAVPQNTTGHGGGWRGEEGARTAAKVLSGSPSGLPVGRCAKKHDPGWYHQPGGRGGHPRT
jgi:hypothetical protein